MRTTIRLDDALLREAKARAARAGRSLNEFIEDAVRVALGFETPHQRAMKTHAQAMKKWRETVKDWRLQDEEVWERMKARSAITPLARKRQQQPPAKLHQTPKVDPTGPKIGLR